MLDSSPPKLSKSRTKKSVKRSRSKQPTKDTASLVIDKDATDHDSIKFPAVNAAMTNDGE